MALDFHSLVTLAESEVADFEAFSMLLTFTPSQGGVFIALQKVMGWTHEAE